MARLTKKKALEITKELWEWLAETGEDYKGEWPGWKKYKAYGNSKRSGRFDSHCGLCEYARRKSHVDTCSYCPLYGKWVAGDSESNCLESDSPFSLWEQAEDIRSRRKYAKIIADLCSEALNKWR